LLNYLLLFSLFSLLMIKIKRLFDYTRLKSFNRQIFRTNLLLSIKMNSSFKLVNSITHEDDPHCIIPVKKYVSADTGMKLYVCNINVTFSSL
jgi:hypothetical protein